LKAWERWTRIFALALLLFVGAGYVYVTFLRSLPPLLTWLIAGAAVAVIALLASVGRVREVILGTTRSTATAAESPGT
jgi:predicted ABC-type exoprotein transport system permease subunit